MGLAEVSIMNHIALVLLLLWIFSSLGWCHPFVFFISLLYLYKVNERYSLRLRRRIQFEERKYANHRRLLSDPESVRWLNQVVEKIWPICMEQIASQQLLLPIIPWFLDKYKPWTARKAIFQHLYLGRTPPTFTGIRVLREADGDDDMVLELGMNFLSAEDMMGILAVQLRKRLGFGMWAKMHVTGMHVEGKVLVGVKFIPHWPFLGRVRVCFVEPPYFQMTVKPIFHHGVDVTELPGIAGWLDKILAVAFEQTLVEPNMLVVDVEKFASATTESWFTVDEKRPIAFVKVEIVEAADMKPSNINGHADPYVKGQLGPYRFRTKTQKKTLAPKWHEEFKIPVSSWEAPNVLAIQVCHKDHIFDDTIGDCLIKISNLRGGQRHDKWLTLQNTKTGRLHLAITVLEGECEKNSNMGTSSDDEELSNVTETTTPRSSVMAQDFSNTDVSSEECRKVSDEFEPINIEGQQRTGIWVHHPGSDTSTTWQARKGRDHRPETQLHSEDCECCSVSSRSVASACTINNDDEETDGSNKIHRRGTVRTGLHKIGLVFHKSSKIENSRQHGAKGGISVRFTEDNGRARNIGDRKFNQRKHSEAGNEHEGIQQVRSRPSIRNG